MALINSFMDTWRAQAVQVGEALNNAMRRRLSGVPEPKRLPERFDFSRPPPGHYRDMQHLGYVRQGHGKLRPLAEAWARWKLKRDPPGMADNRGDAAARAAAWAVYEADL